MTSASPTTRGGRPDRAARSWQPALAWQLVVRNTWYQRRAWPAVVTALVEPAVYFAAVVVGLAAVVDPGADRSRYIAYVAPALLAVCTMNGAVVETTNNVYFRWRQNRLYDSALCTPMSGLDIGTGDVVFGTLRGAVYGAAFLVPLAVVVRPPALSVGLMAIGVLPIAALFSALGLLVVTLVRSWRQLGYVQLAVSVMVLTANTFADLGQHGPLARAWVLVLPLSHANDLLRAAFDRDVATFAVSALVVTGVAGVIGVLGVRRMAAALVD